MKLRLHCTNAVFVSEGQKVIPSRLSVCEAMKGAGNIKVVPEIGNAKIRFERLRVSSLEITGESSAELSSVSMSTSTLACSSVLEQNVIPDKLSIESRLTVACTDRVVILSNDRTVAMEAQGFSSVPQGR